MKARSILSVPALALVLSSIAGSTGHAGERRPARPATSSERPVMIAGHGDLDACLSTSYVRDLRPGGYLSVRAGPSVHARELARLRPGHVVWDCDGAGEWVGIVYHPAHRTQDDIDCTFGRSDTPRRPYRGNCRTGWVHGSYLINLAG